MTALHDDRAALKLYDRSPDNASILGTIELCRGVDFDGSPTVSARKVIELCESVLALRSDCAALRLKCASLEAALQHAASETADPYCVACPTCRKTMRAALSGEPTALREMMEHAVEAGRNEAECDLEGGFEVHNSSNAEVVERILKGGGR